MWTFRRKEAFKTNSPEDEEAILKLAREQPDLGRKRLHAALMERGIEVDSFQLKKFLRAHDIGTAPATRQAIPSWLERRVPQHPWLRYPRSR